MIYEYQPTCQIPPETLDKIYADAFSRFKRDGCLVEVGAHDGWHWSCTWGLAKVGWRAVYIEPVPELYEECLKTYAGLPNVEVVQCAIGEENGTVKIGMCEYGASLLSKDKRFDATQWTLDKLLMLKTIQPYFDLLVIDVEGAEDKVLAGFTLANWMPKLVIIERPPEPNCFTENGYTEVYKDWINVVYAKHY